MAFALVGGCYLYLLGIATVGTMILGDSSQIAGFVFGLGYIILSSLASASILRLCTSLYVGARISSPIRLGLFTLFVALLAPLGGLWLNFYIPFPENFQLPMIYAATVVNGIVLLLPNFRNPTWRRLIWLTQCLLFPFSVYFFAVFLPFTPLAPIGLVFFGGGLLVYVPTMLFLLHGFRIFDGYRAELHAGNKWGPLILGLAAVLVWPAGYTLQTRLDRASLHEALDYLQYPNYSANNRYTGNLSTLRSSLTHLRDFKAGVYLPYLSEYYNWLAFDNLVLPEKKLAELATTFLGEPLPAPGKISDFSQMLRGSTRNSRGSLVEQLSGPTGTRPTQLAQATSTRVSTASEGSVARTSAILQIENPASGTTEFRTLIDVPPGVMISGMWLTIGTERVPGRIFEKRAALWVYQKITEVRPVPRDPAILRYLGPTQAELLVYPVESGTPRTVEVEFLYPDHLSPALRIGATPLGTPTAPSQPALVSARDGNFIAAIPAGSIDAPSVTRQPYLHLLVDVSQKSEFQNPQRLRLALQSALAAFPNVTETKITFVNFETRNFDGHTTLKDLMAFPDEQLAKACAPIRGGFLPTLGIKEILWRHHLALQDKQAAAYHRFPQIVVLPGTATASLSEEDRAQLIPFARFLPDQPGYWILPLNHATPVYTPLDLQNTAQAIQPIHIFQAGNARFAVATQNPIAHISLEPAPTRPTSIEAFDPQTGKFQEIKAAISQPTAPAYAAAISPWSLELGRIYQPYKHKGGDLNQLLQLCRQTGILVPSAAYMVVENSAQWKMLERTEVKTTKSHEALALSEPSAATPEPSTIALLLIGGIVVALHLWRRRRAAVS